MAYDLLGKNFVPPDVHGKVTGKAKYAEDFRAEGMVFCKLMLSPMPHARVRNIDSAAALALPGVHGILTAADVPAAAGARGADLDERADVGRPADPRRRGRHRDDRRRTRSISSRSTSKSCRSRSIRCRACSPAAPTRAPTAMPSTTA